MIRRIVYERFFQKRMVDDILLITIKAASDCQIKVLVSGKKLSLDPVCE